MNKEQEFWSPKNLEEQEHLSPEWLKQLRARPFELDEKNDPRPPANFIDLMNWAQRNFSSALKDQQNLNKFVHNRIIIDGPFMEFCRTRDINVEVLHKDGLISWNSENNFEKFFVQGAFLITCKDVEFLHFSWYHKGNSNEDEISFFIICSEKNFPKYVKLRNEFDKWVLERDRGNLNVRVVAGDDMPYTKDNTWEDLFLPPEIKTEIKNLVENFLSSKDFYLKNKIPWKRGMLLFGKQGNGKSSIIKTIMSMYPFKPVTVVAGANDEEVREAFAYAEEQSPALLYFEDLDSLLEKSLDPSTFLNLMDGISAVNGLLVIATANEVRKLKANITDRPSRFDRKFEIPLPNAEMSLIYLKRWFGNLITPKKCRDLAKYAVKYEFSYAYIKELYISAMFEALSNNRKVPTENDVQVALNRLVKDKNLLNSGSISMDKYLKG